MSYAAIVAGLKTVFEGVTGIKTVLDYVPKVYSSPPMVVISHADTTYDDASDAVQAEYMTRHRIQCRLVLLWQDNEQAEVELAGFIDAIPAAVKADPKLSGALSDGWARVTAGASGWVEQEGVTNPVKYRVCDFTAEVWEV